MLNNQNSPFAFPYIFVALATHSEGLYKWLYIKYLHRFKTQSRSEIILTYCCFGTCACFNTNLCVYFGQILAKWPWPFNQEWHAHVKVVSKIAVRCLLKLLPGLDQIFIQNCPQIMTKSLVPYILKPWPLTSDLDLESQKKNWQEPFMKLTHGNKYFGISQSRLSKMISGSVLKKKILIGYGNSLDWNDLLFFYNVKEPKILILLFHIVVAMATHLDWRNKWL